MPSKTTIRRTLNKVDADALDAQVGAWLLAQAGYGSEEACGEEMVVAVDGGTARGTRQAGGYRPALPGRDHMLRDRGDRSAAGRCEDQLMPNSA